MPSRLLASKTPSTAGLSSRANRQRTSSMSKPLPACLNLWLVLRTPDDPDGQGSTCSGRPLQPVPKNKDPEIKRKEDDRIRPIAG